jgi:L-rhamnose isomerase
VLLTDDVEAIGQELVRGNFLSRAHIGLDFFDASINRVAAWVIGARNVMKALLKALLEPSARLRAAEAAGDYTTRLALLEEYRALPFGPVWDAFCERSGAPVAEAWIADVKRYEEDVLSSRAAPASVTR